MKPEIQSLQEAKKDTPEITWWKAKNLRSIEKSDLLFLLVILFFAFASIFSGNILAIHLTPSGAISAANMLDELQIPRQLPDAPLQDEKGSQSTLWTLANKSRNVVAIYAPWCSPCQKELPELVDNLRESRNLVVIISMQEDPEEARRQFDNLGLKDSKFYLDITGKILKEGKVKSLPTTFLISKNGKVMDRIIGYSEYRLSRLIEKAKRKDRLQGI